MSNKIYQSLPVNPIVSTEIADAIDKPLDMVAKLPCDHLDRSDTSEDKHRNCIDPQLKPKRGKKLGWHDCDPRKMCPGCAAYWHLSCARNFALGVMR